ncbi:hypothetical protein BUALT_Bualt13G0071900 [Buddleja alternifolia]|uniref:Transcription factor RAX2 n=1 Tax=Buddleja alternifolia TaxID=168488 RepID=A0AAV6WWE6_9LAMI|nr:hypothetical protein BUALT_Bualt13G0071900 [Buddleja alternifolia]
MGRAPCCDKANVKKGPWSPEEDAKLKEFMEKFGTGGNWIVLPQKAGLKRCGKSCRLRWLNYLRPNIKHGEFTDEEDRIICTLYASIGSRWSVIASQLPGRTDNDIKNYWNTKLKKKLMGLINPLHQAKFSSSPFSASTQLLTQPLSQLYRDYNSFYNQAAPKSLSPIEAPQNFLYNFPLSTTQYCSSYYQQNQEGLVDLQYNFNPVKDNNNMLIFGGNDQASCSSSDGSCSQISYGNKDHVKQEEIVGQFQGLINSNNGFHNYGKNFNGDPIMSGLVNSQLQCDLEEVKQLISNGNDNINLLFNDENKTEKMGMYYF